MEHTKQEEAILAQAHIDFDYWSQGDTEGYGKSAAKDVTFFNNDPADDRVDGIQAFRKLLTSWKGQIPPHNYKIVDPKIQVYGNIGIFTLQYQAFSPDGELLAQARGTCVYRQANDSWEMVHTHWSTFDLKSPDLSIPE
ncbi:MAG: nuclear transport factor 2 family protein [Cyclobacteriaceae bacterium]|nr:nuclear transport factor 2 family protein [Cyclobacteriaceae bacterium]